MQHQKVVPTLVCLAAGLFSFYDVFQLTLFNVISKNLLSDFSFSHYSLGLFSASFLVANALWLIPAGRMLDRYSPRRIGLFFFAIAIIATLILALSHQLFVSTAARIAQGMASATSLLLCTRIASQCFPQSRGFAIGCMFAMASVGGLCANTFWPAVVNVEGWRSALLISSVIGSVFFIYMWFFLCVPFKANSDLSFNESTSIRLISSKVIGFGIYIGLMSLPLFILGALWGNIFLVQTYHISLAQAGLVTGMLFWGMLPGTPLIGGFNDSIQKPYLIMGVGPILCVALICILMLGTSVTLTELCAIFFLLGFISSCQGLAFAQLASEYPLFKRSTAIAIAALAENLIGAISQPLFGRMIDVSKSIFIFYPENWHYRIALLVFPIGFLACTFIIVMIKFKSSSILNQGVIGNAA